MAVAEVTNGDTPAALVDAKGPIGFVFFEVQSRMARVRNKLSQRNIDPILNVRSQFCIGLQEALRPRDPHRHGSASMLLEVGDQIFRIVEGRTSPVIRITLRSLRKKEMIKINARVVLRHSRIIKPLQNLFRKMRIVR